MSLTAGSRLGAHEILGLLGAGGMGEVYLAQDTRLNRRVAIKVLPEAYASDPDRVARFHREAQAVAALNHASIAAIYDLAEADGTKYLVLELIEGDTLADRLKRGPIPVEDALQIAKQILEALEAAHEKGICHRDLKPANIKLTAEGGVKVLDFGLAKFLQSATSAPHLTHSPTMSLGGTYPGVILGTAGYMSPEQAKGFEADQRSDIFSFGCILFEMLTGRQAFEGETASEILASVLKIDVDLTTLPPRLNPRLVETLRRCLEKNPKKRWHAAADVRIEIESLIERAVVVDEPLAPVAARRPWWRALMWPAVVSAVVAAAAVYATWVLKPEPARMVSRFRVVLPDDQRFTNVGRQLIAISRDGANLVYVANQRLYLRSMSGLDARVIAGSETSAGVTSPAFSPDGQWVAYRASADSTIKRLSTAGGTPTTICTVTGGVFGLSWSAHGIIFGEFGKGIVRVSPGGGAPAVIAPVGDDEVADAPQLLPDGQAVLFTVRKRSDTWDKAQIVVQPLDGGARKTIIDGGADGKYVPTGHLVYAVSGVLMAVPFDLRTLATRDRSVAIVEGVRRGSYAGLFVAAAGTASTTSAAQYTFSATGALAYVQGPADVSSATVHDLALFDRKAPSVVPVKLPPAQYNALGCHPTAGGLRSKAWMSAVRMSGCTLAGTSATRRLTFGGSNQAPTWSADSQWIAFTSDRERASGIFRQRADGSGAAERLTKAEAGITHIPQSWSADGEHLLFTALTANHSMLWILSLKDGRATRFGDVESPVAVEAEFSPNGRWVAYYVREGETNATYVQPFPLTGTKYLVPAAGAAHPFWSRSGGEITVSLGPVQNASLTVTTTPHFAFGRPELYSRAPLQQGAASSNLRRNLDPLPNGRILGVISATSGFGLDLTEIVVVLNWFDELRQRVPVR